MRVWRFLRGTGAANRWALAYPHLTVFMFRTVGAWIAFGPDENA
jgi:hypothetical protein